MIKDFEIPIFQLRKTVKYNIAAGGGGNISYGFENGIIVQSNSCSGQEFFYKTDEIIIKLEVYDLRNSDFNDKHEIAFDDSEIENSEQISSNLSSEFSTQAKKSDAAEDTSEERNKQRESEDCLLIAGSSEFSTFCLKFNGSEFTELLTVNAGASQIYLSSDLIILFRLGYIHAYHNIASASSIEIQDPQSLAVDKTSMQFTMEKQKEHILFKGNESSNFVVPVSCSNFYISGNVLFPIRYNNNQSKFIKDGSVSMHDDKIENVFSNNFIFGFYIQSEKFSKIFVNGRESQVFRITDFSLKKNVLAVSTIKGDIVVFNVSGKKRTMSVTNIPVTSIDIMDDKIYYSLITGATGEKSIHPSFSFRFLFFIFFAICLSFLSLQLYKLS